MNCISNLGWDFFIVTTAYPSKCVVVVVVVDVDVYIQRIKVPNETSANYAQFKPAGTTNNSTVGDPVDS